jgi:hypothetical protein
MSATEPRRTQPAQRPRVAIAGPLLHGSGELHIVGREKVLTIGDPDGSVHRLLSLADGSRTRDEIFTALTIDFPLLGEREVDEALRELEEAGLIEDAVPRGRIRSGSLWAGGFEGGFLSSL